MKETSTDKAILNFILASFLTLSFLIGLAILAGSIDTNEPLTSRAFAGGCLFIVGGFGIITFLYIFNTNKNTTTK